MFISGMIAGGGWLYPPTPKKNLLSEILFKNANYWAENPNFEKI